MNIVTIKKSSIARTGRKASKEAKKNMSMAHKGKSVGAANPMYGKRGELSPNFGKPCKESTRKLISERAKERWAKKKMQQNNSQ